MNRVLTWLFETAKRTFNYEPPQNCITVQQYNEMKEMILQRTQGFELTCSQSRYSDIRINVGMLAPEGASDEETRFAANMFIASANQIGAFVNQDEVLLYTRGNKVPEVYSRLPKSQEYDAQPKSP